ncbi:MAG: TIGR02186 family protein [Kiloniellales bacterium]|jgi:uncharacterized protein (TIGR02186 family)
MSRHHAIRPPGFAVAWLLLLALSSPARATSDVLVADLSRHLVAITTGFAGTDVLLFGAIEDKGDVVVIVRGPDRPMVMHRKSRVLGVWINTASMTFARAPSFYAVASSRPLAQIAAQTVLAREEMGIQYLRLDLPRAKASPNVAAEWRAGLIRNHQRDGLYKTEVGRVIFLGNRLFRAEFQLPANVPTGEYQVKVLLLQDGHVVKAQTTPLTVDKIGAEALVYNFAYEQSALYGIFAILVALMAGWLAHMAFRKA